MDNVWKGLTALIALSRLLVGFQQWWISREKVRLELFEKRYAVFEAVRKFVVRIVGSSVVELAWRHDYWRETVNTQFLFESDVVDYVDKVNK